MHDEDYDRRNEMRVDECLAHHQSLDLRGNDKKIYMALRRVCDPYIEEYQDHLLETGTKLELVLQEINLDASPTVALRKRIVGMIRYGYVDEGMLLQILLHVYVNRGLYDELLDVCEDVLNFKGDDRNRLLSSTLVESAIHQIVYRLAETDSLDANAPLASRCLHMLERRARTLRLNIDMRTDETDQFRKVSLIALDVVHRRSFEPARTLAPWIRKKYPYLSKTLNLNREKISSMIRKKAPLLYVASILLRLEKDKLVVPKSAFRTFDELEHMLQLVLLDNVKTDNTERYNEWKVDTCNKKLYQSLFEMRLYLHLRNIAARVELEPPIDDPKCADLKVRDIYIEAYSPHDVLPTAFGHVPPANPYDDLIYRIFNKDQIEYFGARKSLLAVEDPGNYVNDATFQEKLSKELMLCPQLGGVLVVQNRGSCNVVSFVRNPDAEFPISSIDETLLKSSLEGSCVPVETIVIDLAHRLHPLDIPDGGAARTPKESLSAIDPPVRIPFLQTPALPDASELDGPCAPSGNLFLPSGSASARPLRLVDPGDRLPLGGAPMRPCAQPARVLCPCPGMLCDSWQCAPASPWAISCACQAAVCVRVWTLLAVFGIFLVWRLFVG